MPSTPQPWARRCLAFATAVILLLATPAAAVRPSGEPMSRGDVMRMLYTDDVPDEIEPLARTVRPGPGRIELAGTPRAPAEPARLPATGQVKGLLPGSRGRRGRRG